MIVRYFARQLRVTARHVERALFSAHKDFQPEGEKLYQPVANGNRVNRLELTAEVVSQPCMSKTTSAAR